MTYATLKIYDGNVFLETDGNPSVVEITYKGKFDAKSNLPDGFIQMAGKERLLILRLSDKEFPENLFSYNGYFEAEKVVLYKDKTRLTGNIEVPDSRWNYLSKSTSPENFWNISNGFWQNYSDYRHYGGVEAIERKLNGRFTDIVTNSIKSVSGNLVTKDGEPYYGDVHYHSAGYFMTGGVHNEDSVRLYTKNRIRITRRRNG